MYEWFFVYIEPYVIRNITGYKSQLDMLQV